jgi:ParB-like chromosome segregation protein Spo0J
LAENPLNWRRHPAEQINALTDVIADVGWAGACLYNERTGRLIDGHARRKTAIDQGAELIPVLVGSWDEEQEKKILATLDPLAAMAAADEAKLAELLDGLKFESEAVGRMLIDVFDSVSGAAATPSPDFEPVGAESQGRLDERSKVRCPECGHEFSR